MATTDKRELLLVIKGDDKASKPLKQVGDAADDTADDLKDLNAGLKKLDDSTAEATETIARLRAEVAKTGDLDLLKDVQRQEQRLKAFARQRRLLVGDDGPKFGSAMKLPLPDIDVSRAGVGVANRLGATIVQQLPKAMSSGGGAGGVGAAIGIPVAVGVATWLSSAAAGAILAGGAAVAVAGGVKIAAKDARVEAAAGSLAESIGAELKDAAKPFVPATLKAIGTVRSEFRGFGAELGSIFASSADYLDPFVRGLLGLAREALPGVRDFIRGARPVVDMLGQQLPELGGEIGDAFSMIGSTGPAAARALEALFEVVGVSIKTVAGGLKVAGEAFKWVDILTSTFRGPRELAKTVAGYQIKAVEAEQATGEFAGGLKGLDGAATSAATSMKSLTDEINGITSGNLSMAQATLAAEQAIVDTTAAIKENNKSGKDSKQIHRDNESELHNLADALNGATQALNDNGVGADAARDAYERNREALIRAAIQTGKTRAEAERLADEWLNVPRGVSTKASADTKKAEESAVRLRKKIDDIDRYVPITARINAVVDPATRSALRLGRLSRGGPVEGAGIKGVDSLPYLLAPGEYVLSARDVDRLGGTDRIDAWRQSLHDATRPAAGGAGVDGRRAGAVPPIVINAAGATGLERMFLSWLLEAIRNAGGRPTALGL